MTSEALRTLIVAVQEKAPNPQVVGALMAYIELPIFHYLRRILGHWHDAEDALGETLLKVYRARLKAEVDEDLVGWIYTIARNAAIDLLRRRRRYLTLPLLDELLPAPEEKRDDLQELQEFLRRFSDDPQILCLRYLEGKSTAEIRSELGLASENAVYIRLHHARKQLEERLTEAGLLAEAATHIE